MGKAEIGKVESRNQSGKANIQHPTSNIERSTSTKGGIKGQ
jgi:hypothetical protein